MIILIQKGSRFLLSYKISLVLFFGGIVVGSCTSRSYPCPSNGQTTASSLSRFDEDGNLKDSKKRYKRNDKGLVQKKQHKQLKRRKKTSLDDRPKNLKK